MKCVDCQHIKGVLQSGLGACWANPNKRRQEKLFSDEDKAKAYIEDIKRIRKEYKLEV